MCVQRFQRLQQQKMWCAGYNPRGTSGAATVAMSKDARDAQETLTSAIIARNK
jgi:hypothetical protein